MQEIGVTVICLVYNHEKYLRKCLESFISQKTTFPIRAIVHDDASTDGSRKIIEEFEERFPDIICPIYQSKNQYSQKTDIVRSFIQPMVHSRYVAYCEGDDYWCCDDKLQCQYDAMEAHPECGVCLHRVQEVREDATPTGLEIPGNIYNTGIIAADDLFANFSRMFQTSSYFFRADLWHDFINNPPSYCKACDTGDVQMMLYFGSRFKIYQINEVMSCYRRGAVDGWWNRKLTDNLIMRNHRDSLVHAYKLFDEDTDYVYHTFILDRVSKHLYAKCALDGNFKDFFSKENAEYRKELPFVKRMTVYLGLIFPSLVKATYRWHIKKERKVELKRWYGDRH